MWIMWIKSGWLFIANLKLSKNKEFNIFLLQLLSNYVNYIMHKNPHAQGYEHVEDLVDSVDNSIDQGYFRRFYTHLRHP